jgi:hypothetical protein
MALKRLIFIFSFVFLASAIPSHAKSTLSLFTQLEHAETPHKIDTLVLEIQQEWFQEPFEISKLQAGYPRLLEILKTKHKPLHNRIEAQWVAVQDLHIPNTDKERSKYYDLFRGNLMVMSDKIEHRKYISDESKFRTYVLSYVLSATPAKKTTDWDVWKGLARNIGHEMNVLADSEKWIQKNAPHPIARRILPLFEHQFKKTYGMEGPKRTLNEEDTLRLKNITRLIFSSPT